MQKVLMAAPNHRASRAVWHLSARHRRRHGASIRPLMRTTRRPLVLVAILASMFMSAMEATVVATVMPTVIAELRGIELYGTKVKPMVEQMLADQPVDATAK